MKELTAQQAKAARTGTTRDKSSDGCISIRPFFGFAPCSDGFDLETLWVEVYVYCADSTQMQYFYGVRAVFIFFYFYINENLSFVSKNLETLFGRGDI